MTSTTGTWPYLRFGKTRRHADLLNEAHRHDAVMKDGEKDFPENGHRAAREQSLRMAAALLRSSPKETAVWLPAADNFNLL